MTDLWATVRARDHQDSIRGKDSLLRVTDLWATVSRDLQDSIRGKDNLLRATGLWVTVSRDLQDSSSKEIEHLDLLRLVIRVRDLWDTRRAIDPPTAKDRDLQDRTRVTDLPDRLLFRDLPLRELKDLLWDTVKPECRDLKSRQSLISLLK